ncbi:MAG: hypothetical protein ACD_23C00570G0002 [uncultured bacterium]|nr:MAG: hypothetical protein ACD_23C00570G0002 [uncultured bacterium]
MQLLSVPFAQKDEAKALGARWNPKVKRWFVPDNVDVAPFVRWIEPQTLKSDRESAHSIKSPRLYIDMIPTTAWYSNLRSILTPEEWQAVKIQTATAAHHHCQACGNQGGRHPVECHELWNFNYDTYTQVLTRTVALCPDCHRATHFGLARVKGYADAAKAHLMKVNGWSQADVALHIINANDEFQERNCIDWILDARWVLDFVPISEKSRQVIVGLAEARIERTQRSQTPAVAAVGRTKNPFQFIEDLIDYDAPVHIINPPSSSR